MDKCNYESIDWSKCPSIEKSQDIENTNKHIMDVELPEDECKEINSKKESVL